MAENKNTTAMTWMSSIDSLARDIAYEIILGGDRFDQYDIKPMLDGVTRAEMNFFKDRIHYHAVDFAPAEFRTDEFLSREIEAWMRDIVVRESWEIRPEFQQMHDRVERGKWFRFADGDFRRCMKATVDCQWVDAERVGMEPKPFDALVVAREKADALITAYGHELNLDGPVCTLDILTCGALESGYVMSVRRNVDILADKPEDHHYFITYKTPSGSSSTLLDKLTPEELERFIGDMEQEKQLRAGAKLGWVDRSEPFVLPEGTVVLAPEPSTDGVRSFEAVSLWENIDGDVIVSGFYTQGRGAEGPDGVEFNKGDVNFFLKDFSDRGIAVISAATQKVLKLDVAMKEKQVSQKKKPVFRSKGVE